MAIVLRVKGQALSLGESVFLAGGTSKYPQVFFTFDDDWTGFSKIATFKTSNSELYRMAIVDGCCVMPAEVMIENENINIGVYGTKGNTRITTGVISIPCHQSGYGNGIDPSEPTADLITQIQAEIENVKENYLSKEQFRLQLSEFCSQILGAMYRNNYDGVYYSPLNGFRISKSDYNPNNGDVVAIWVKNQLLSPGIDYSITECEEYWEIGNSSYTATAHLTVQIWTKLTAGGCASGVSLSLLTGNIGNGIAGVATEVEEETEE